jgi:hypothetical protein
MPASWVGLLFMRQARAYLRGWRFRIHHYQITSERLDYMLSNLSDKQLQRLYIRVARRMADSLRSGETNDFNNRALSAASQSWRKTYSLVFRELVEREMA